jgi:hypothetical protein
MPIAYGLVKVKKVGTDTGRTKKGDNQCKESTEEDLVNLSQSGNFLVLPVSVPTFLTLTKPYAIGI